jgi:WD40 repeat protein
MELIVNAKFLLVIAIWAISSVGQGANDAPVEPISFIRQVAPILVGRCEACHGKKTAESNYRVDTFQRFMQPGDYESPPITEGDLDDSEVHRLIIAEEADERMPNNGDQLSANEIQIIELWINQGAKFDGRDPVAPLRGQIPHLAHPAAPGIYPAPIPITAATFTVDGKRLLVGGYHEILVWDPENATLLQRLTDIPQRTYGLAFSPDGKFLAVAGGAAGVSGEVQLIAWQDGSKAETGTKYLASHSDVFFDVAFRPDSQQLAATCSDGSIRLFDVATGVEQLKIDNHSDWVTAVCYSADGKRLATSSRDQTAKAFDAQTGELLATYSGHGAAVRAVAFMPDGNKVISAGGGKVRVWNIEDSKLSGEMAGFGGDVYALVSNEETLIAASADRTARQFNLSDRKQAKVFADHPDSVLSITWDLSGGRICTGCFDGAVSIWNLKEGTLLKRFLAVPPSPENKE